MVDASNYKRKFWYRLVLLCTAIVYIAGLVLSYVWSAPQAAYSYTDYSTNQNLYVAAVPFNWHNFILGLCATVFVAELLRSVVIWLVTGNSVWEEWSNILKAD